MRCGAPHIPPPFPQGFQNPQQNRALGEKALHNSTSPLAAQTHALQERAAAHREPSDTPSNKSPLPLAQRPPSVTLQNEDNYWGQDVLKFCQLIVLNKQKFSPWKCGLIQDLYIELYRSPSQICNPWGNFPWRCPALPGACRIFLLPY